MFTRVSVTQWKPPTLSHGNRWTPSPPTTTITHTHTHTHTHTQTHRHTDTHPPPTPAPPMWTGRCPPSQSEVTLSDASDLLLLSRSCKVDASHSSLHPNSLTPWLSTLSALSAPLTPVLQTYMESMWRWSEWWRRRNRGRSEGARGVRIWETWLQSISSHPVTTGYRHFD